MSDAALEMSRYIVDADDPNFDADDMDFLARAVLSQHTRIQELSEMVRVANAGLLDAQFRIRELESQVAELLP